MINCHQKESCSAPICPLDKKSLHQGIWYPDEEICRKKGFMTEYPFIQRQKKISRKTRDLDSYYTAVMLKRDFIIGKGIVGLDPDKPRELQERAWIGKHPEKRKLMEVEKQAVRERFRRGSQKDFYARKSTIRRGFGEIAS